MDIGLTCLNARFPESISDDIGDITLREGIHSQQTVQ
jgi:hypothetical protein